MKNFISIPMLLVLLTFCGYGSQGENSETRFWLDSVVSQQSELNEDAPEPDFALRADYLRLFCYAAKKSVTPLLKDSESLTTPRVDMSNVVEGDVFYGNLSGGKPPVIAYLVILVWNFKNQTVPDRDEIAAALRNIDYHSI